jgi:hypothetical protein
MKPARVSQEEDKKDKTARESGRWKQDADQMTLVNRADANKRRRRCTKLLKRDFHAAS